MIHHPFQPRIPSIFHTTYFNRRRDKIHMEEAKKSTHFVLIHGLFHGAWCWYRLKPLLEKAGHRVTALDMAASGINMKSIEEVHTFKEYSEPLLTFMASLASTEKVILVGHSLGGMNSALAMEDFPEKISVAVFLAAFLPDTIHQPSHVLEKFREITPDEAWLDTRFSTYGSLENPGTSILLGDEFTSHLYPASSIEDLKLAKMLKRPSSRFVHDLSRAEKFTDRGYGSVKKLCLIGKEDRGLPVEFHHWMIQNNGGTTELLEIEGADHMPMLSNPQAHSLLVSSR